MELRRQVRSQMEFGNEGTREGNQRQRRGWSLEDKGIPKLELGNEKKILLARAFQQVAQALGHFDAVKGGEGDEGVLGGGGHGLILIERLKYITRRHEGTKARRKGNQRQRRGWSLEDKGIPKLELGNEKKTAFAPSQWSCADKCVPKWSLGTRETRETRRRTEPDRSSFASLREIFPASP